MTHIPSFLRVAALAAIAILTLGSEDCAQALDSGSAPGPGDTDTDTPWDGGDSADLPDVSGLTGDCAPVAWLTCGDTWAGDSSDPNSGFTDVIDFWDVAVGNYTGNEVAFAFRPGSSGIATIGFVDPDPNEVNLDIFMIRGSDECRSEDVFGRGFNSLDFEANGGQTHFIVVDGFDGDAGAFEIELECDLGGSDGPTDPVDQGCPTDLDVPGTVRSVLNAHDLDDLDVTFPPGQTVIQQGWDNEVCFEQALDAAAESLLGDGSDVESPLALVADIDEGPCLQDDLRERVRCFMNEPHSRIDLVVPGGPHQPEHGESLDDHWVFFLDLPALSDHLYWAIVPRDGSGGASNYGFN